MLKEYYEVDSLTGLPIEKYVYEETEVPEGLIPGWAGSLHHPVFDFVTESWKEGSFTEDELEDIRDSKISELNDLCEGKIVKGFLASNGHWYRTNRDDQTNMIGQKDELTADPSILTILWKTEDAGYVIHTREEWLQIYKEAFQHKKTQLFKYDAYKNEVRTLTEPTEIKNFKWV